MYVLCTRNFDWILTLLCWDVPLEQFVKDHNSFQLRKYAFYIYTSTSIPFQYMMKIKENQTHAKILYLANIRHTANSKTSTKYRLQFCTSYMPLPDKVLLLFLCFVLLARLRFDCLAIPFWENTQKRQEAQPCRHQPRPEAGRQPQAPAGNRGISRNDPCWFSSDRMDTHAFNSSASLEM